MSVLILWLCSLFLNSCLCSYFWFGLYPLNVSVYVLRSTFCSDLLSVEENQLIVLEIWTELADINFAASVRSVMVLST